VLYDVTLLNLTHVVYSYPSTIKDLMLHEQGVAGSTLAGSTDDTETLRGVRRREVGVVLERGSRHSVAFLLLA